MKRPRSKRTGRACAFSSSSECKEVKVQEEWERMRYSWNTGLPRWCKGKESACQGRRHKRHGFDPWVGKILEEEMATHSSILAWRIPWTEESSRLQSMGSQTQFSDWTTTKRICQCYSLKSSRSRLSLLCPTYRFSVSASLFLPWK